MEMRGCLGVLLTRYEFSFCGESQGIGFVQGLMDIGLAENQVGFLTDSFDRHLVIPKRSVFHFDRSKYDAFSYFTKKGLIQFDREINNIRTWIKNMDNEWEVQEIPFTIKENAKEILYQDKYQMIVLIPHVR